MLLNLRQPRLLRRLPLQPQHMLPRLSHRRPRLHKRTVSLPLRLLRCMNTLPCLDDTRVLMLFSREQTTAGVAGAFGVAAEDAAGGLLFAVAGGDGGDGIAAAAAGEETAAGFLVRGGSWWGDLQGAAGGAGCAVGFGGRRRCCGCWFGVLGRAEERHGVLKRRGGYCWRMGKIVVE